MADDSAALTQDTLLLTQTTLTDNIKYAHINDLFLKVQYNISILNNNLRHYSMYEYNGDKNKLI